MKYIEYVFNADTREEKINERDYTTEELVEIEKQKISMQKQLIEQELAELDIIVPRVVEDIVTQGGFTLHPTKQAIIDRKNELRQQLKDL